MKVVVELDFSTPYEAEQFLEEFEEFGDTDLFAPITVDCMDRIRRAIEEARMKLVS